MTMKNNASRDQAHQQKRSLLKSDKIINVHKYHMQYIKVNEMIVKFSGTLLSQIIEIVKHRIVKFLLSTTAPRVSRTIIGN